MVPASLLALSIIEVCWYSYYSIIDVLSEESFSSNLYLTQNHSGNFFWSEVTGLTSNSYLNNWLVVVGNNSVWYKLRISLNGFIRVVTSDKTLKVKNGVFWVDGSLILCSISNKTVSAVHESNVRMAAPPASQLHFECLSAVNAAFYL